MTKIEFDPHRYSILVRRMEVDGELVYVGKAAEFPHVAAFESTFQAAYDAVANVITDLHVAAREEGNDFPPPLSEPEASGRFTLRLPPWLQTNLQGIAQREGISLNAHICNVLVAHNTVESVLSAAAAQVVARSAPTQSAHHLKAWGNMVVIGAGAIGSTIVEQMDYGETYMPAIFPAHR